MCDEVPGDSMTVRREEDGYSRKGNMSKISLSLSLSRVRVSVRGNLSLFPQGVPFPKGGVRPFLSETTEQSRQQKALISWLFDLVTKKKMLMTMGRHNNKQGEKHIEGVLFGGKELSRRSPTFSSSLPPARGPYYAIIRRNELQTIDFIIGTWKSRRFWCRR